MCVGRWSRDKTFKKYSWHERKTTENISHGKKNFGLKSRKYGLFIDLCYIGASKCLNNKHYCGLEKVLVASLYLLPVKHRFLFCLDVREGFVEEKSPAVPLKRFFFITLMRSHFKYPNILGSVSINRFICIAQFSSNSVQRVLRHKNIKTS